MKIVFRVDPNAAYIQFRSRLVKTISRFVIGKDIHNF
jgi:hypothetical protein